MNNKHNILVTFDRITGEEITGLWNGRIIKSYSHNQDHIVLDQIKNDGEIISLKILLNAKSSKYLRAIR